MGETKTRFGQKNLSAMEDLCVKKYQIVTPRPAKWADFSLNDMSHLEQLGIYRYFEFVIAYVCSVKKIIRQ